MSALRRLSLAALLLAACAGPPPPALRYGTPAQAGLDPDSLAVAVAEYRDLVERDELRGVVLLVARHGVVALHEAIGWRDKEAGRPLERDALFRMASNTKPLVATAVLQLAEQGRLRLAEPVGTWLPAFRTGPSAAITVHHLLSHTSGLRIPTIFLDPLMVPTPEHPEAPTLRLEADRFAAVGPAVTPGTSYRYSNPGFNILGALVETVSGEPLADYLRQHIYEPLRMHDSCNHETAADPQRMGTVYRRGRAGWQTGWQPGDAPDYPFVRASGGMISTAWDYALFLQAWLEQGSCPGGRILLPESVVQAWTSHTGDLPPPPEGEPQPELYGYGWVVGEGGLYSHSGSDGTYAWVDPVAGIVGCVFTQSPGGTNPRSRFARRMRAAVRP